LWYNTDASKLLSYYALCVCYRSSWTNRLLVAKDHASVQVRLQFFLLRVQQHSSRTTVLYMRTKAYDDEFDTPVIGFLGASLLLMVMRALQAAASRHCSSTKGIANTAHWQLTMDNSSSSSTCAHAMQCMLMALCRTARITTVSTHTCCQGGSVLFLTALSQAATTVV
jgi:hypothetical protein